MSLSEDEEFQLLSLERERSMGGGSAPQQSTPLMQQLMGKMLGPDRAQKAYSMASIPMQKSQQGLEMMADGLTPSPETTGNPTMDVIRNYPAISARTLSKVAPSFISPESLATTAIAPVAGLAGKGIGKVVKPVAKWLGGQAEEFLGMVPDSLKSAYNDAGLILSNGKKAASPLYEEGKALAESTKEAPKTRFFDANGVLQEGPSKIDKLKTVAENATEHRKLFNSAVKLEEAGALDADTALSARKSMWKIKKSIPEDQFYDKLAKFNKVIKENVYMKQGDDLFKRGLMAESLRSIFPKTASGKPSSWKAMMGGLSGVPAAFSPLALGSTATALGLAGRKILSPLLNAPVGPAMTAVSLLRSKRNDQ